MLNAFQFSGTTFCKREHFEMKRPLVFCMVRNKMSLATDLSQPQMTDKLGIDNKTEGIPFLPYGAYF